MLGVVLGVFFLSFGAQAEVIRVGDILEISLKGVPAAEQAKVYSKLEVRSSGVIRVPMVNIDIKAAGRKPEDVERSIEAVLKKSEIYRAPTISIHVHDKKAGEQEMKKMLSVGGHVRRNGRVLFRDGMTLMEAIQQAGGRDTFGSKTIHLTRKNNKGQSILYKYDITKAVYQTLRVYPNDVIHIPQKRPFE